MKSDKRPSKADQAPATGSAKSIADSAAWKKSRQGASRIWNNYRNVLSSSFSRMSRLDQERLVQKMCMIVTMGVTGVALLIFYPLIPMFIRVFLVPVAMVAAYWAGINVVTSVVLDRLSGLIKPEQTGEDWDTEEQEGR